MATAKQADFVHEARNRTDETPRPPRWPVVRRKADFSPGELWYLTILMRQFLSPEACKARRLGAVGMRDEEE